MSNRISISVSILIHGILMSAIGCQTSANVKWADLPSSDAPILDIRTEALSKDVRSAEQKKVGHHTFTLFALPTMSVLSNEPVAQRVETGIREAFRSAGYNLTSDSPDASLTMSGELKHFHFWSYNWLYPITILGGSIAVELDLHDSRGDSIWKKEFKASSGFPNIFVVYGFETMIKSSMDKILDQINEECNQPEFRELVASRIRSTKEKSPSGLALTDERSR